MIPTHFRDIFFPHLIKIPVTKNKEGKEEWVYPKNFHFSCILKVEGLGRSQWGELSKIAIN